MIFHRIFQCFRSDSDNKLQQQQGGSSGKYQIFSGNDKNLIKNGKILLEERISLFDGRTNSIRCFSVDELNSMNVNNLPYIEEGYYNIYTGVWDGNPVMVKCSNDWFGYDKGREQACREIAVATQMGTHSNVHRLLGFCLVTNYPVLIYEWAENGTLKNRVLKYREQGKHALEWKDRLRIAWEIAHAVSFLHTAFHQPCILRNLNPRNVFLDQDDSSKLSDFSIVISIPKGKKHVQENGVMGISGYVAPDYSSSFRVMESVDVFSFGVLLIVLLTRKSVCLPTQSDYGGMGNLVFWVRDRHSVNDVGDIVDPAITRDGSFTDEHFKKHLQEFVELALRCSSDEGENRPTMVEVATELKNMIMSLTHFSSKTTCNM